MEEKNGFTFEEAHAEANRCLSCKNPRCENGCPTKMRIRDFISQIKKNNLLEARTIIDSVSNLPSICSRVCPHEKQCVGSCILNAKNNPIQIGSLEKYVCDSISRIDKNIIKNNIKVAIVGSGPASLSCALELTKAGFSVSIFEKENYYGGVLSYGIPEFRLNKKYVHDIIEDLESMGVKFSKNIEVNKKFIEDLKQQNFYKVFLGVGLPKGRTLKIPNDYVEHVYDALDLLKVSNYNLSYNNPKRISLTGKTMVVGAGNVAIDAARMAIRLGSSEVTIVYRRTKEEAPACKSEMDMAVKEGIKFLFLTNPVEVYGEKEVTGIRCEIMTLGMPDESGRRAPIGSGNYIDIECDNVIAAIGQVPDKKWIESIGIKNDSGYIITNADFFTSDDFLLAGGDIVSKASTVVVAMKQGKEAALSIIEEYQKK